MSQRNRLRRRGCRQGRWRSRRRAAEPRRPPLPWGRQDRKGRRPSGPGRRGRHTLARPVVRRRTPKGCQKPGCRMRPRPGRRPPRPGLTDRRRLPPAGHRIRRPETHSHPTRIRRGSAALLALRNRFCSAAGPDWRCRQWPRRRTCRGRRCGPRPRRRHRSQRRRGRRPLPPRRQRSPPRPLAGAGWDWRGP